MSNKIYANLITQLDKVYRHNRQGSFKTRERYRDAMKRFCRFLAEVYYVEKLPSIAAKHIYTYVENMKMRDLSASTIKTDLAAIRFFHDQIPNAKYKLPSNDALELESRTYGKVNRAWTQREFNRFICACWEHNREDYAALACLARYAGLRIHECFRIDTAVANNAVKNMAITIKGKNGKIRTVPINESIQIELNKMLAITPRGHKLFVQDEKQTDAVITQLQQFIIKYRNNFMDEDSEIPKSFHGLRHLYAAETYSNLLSSGKTEQQAMYEVSELLGHNRPEVTRIYLASLKDGGNDV